MRDADEWAKSLSGAEYVDDDSGWQTHKIAALIREAQLDGVRHEASSPHPHVFNDGWGPTTHECLVCGKLRGEVKP